MLGMNQGRTSDVLGGVLFLIVGVVLVSAGVVTGAARQRFIKEAATAQGTVLETLSGGSHPDIEFAVAAGAKVRYPQGGWAVGYHPGDRVRVLYSFDNPRQTACLDSFGALWFTPLICGVLGIGFLIAGVVQAFGVGAGRA